MKDIAGVTEADIHKLVSASQNDATTHLNEKQLALIKAYTDEDSPTKFQKKASMRVAGYSPSYNWTQVFPGIRDEVIERTKDLLAEAAPEAASKLIEYIRDPETVAGGRDKLHAIQMLFDRAGVVKGEKIDVEVTHNAVFVLPPKKHQEAVDLDFEDISDG